MNIIVKYIVIVLITGSAAYFAFNATYNAGYKAGANSVITDTITIVRTDTINRIKPVLHFIKDTVNVQKYVNVDSIFNVALVFWQSKYPDNTDSSGYTLQGNYAAEMDTTIDDNDLKLHVSFVSPLPLHPNSFFNYDYSFKKVVCSQINEREDFWHHFGFQLGAGLAVDFGRNQLIPTVYFGYGLKF